MTKSNVAGVLAAAVLLVLSACGDGDETTITASPTATESGTPTGSPAGTPTPMPSETYTNDRFGYTVTLPAGWRAATAFMDAYAALGAQPQGVGYSGDYAVLTDMSADDELTFVQRVTSETPIGLTGIEVWLDFFLQRSVEIYPTSTNREQVLNSVRDGNVWHLVTNVRDVELTSGEVVTRYDLELASDYGHFAFDTVYVPANVDGCTGCSGFIVQTASAGVPSEGSSGTIELPPAAYPQDEFNTIVSSFRFN